MCTESAGGGGPIKISFSCLLDFRCEPQSIFAHQERRFCPTNGNVVHILVGWLVGGVHLECFHANSVSTWRMYAHTRTGFGLWASLAIAQTQLSFVLSQRKILQSAGLTPVQWSRVYSALASSLARALVHACIHPDTIRHLPTIDPCGRTDSMTD